VCPQVVGSGKHVLGYVVIGPMAVLLLVEKTRVSTTLPGNHQVKTLVTTRWHKIPLQVCGAEAGATDFYTASIACFFSKDLLAVDGRDHM